MADPLTPEEARRRLRAVARGRHLSDPQLDLETAKARLREADPGIDIGPALAHLGRGRWQPLLAALLPWAVSPAGRSYLAPLLLYALGAFQGVLGLLRREPARGSEAQAAQEAPPEPANDHTDPLQERG